MNGHDVAPGLETAIIREDEKKTKMSRWNVRYLRLGSGYVAAISSREIDTSEKKNISGGARRLFDSEQVILSTNFYRNFFDRAIVVRIQLFLQLLSVQFFK